MRLLLDESLPRLLGEQLLGHEVRTVQSIGWAGVGNGELLRLAAEAGFEALVTPDRGFEFEQNPEALSTEIFTVPWITMGGNGVTIHAQEENFEYF